VNIPELRLPGLNWLITQVAFVVDLQRGKVAEVTLMPPEAFTPQPPSTLWDPQIQQAMQEAASSGAMTAPASSVSTSGLLGHACCQARTADGCHFRTQ
jgi:prophage tail gpP-like protein